MAVSYDIQPLRPDQSFAGYLPYRARKFKDVSFSILFFLAFLGMLYFIYGSLSADNQSVLDSYLESYFKGDEDANVRSIHDILMANKKLFAIAGSSVFIVAALFVQLYKHFSLCALYFTIAVVLASLGFCGGVLLSMGHKVPGILFLVALVAVALLAYFNRTYIEVSAAILSESSVALSENILMSVVVVVFSIIVGIIYSTASSLSLLLSINFVYSDSVSSKTESRHNAFLVIYSLLMVYWGLYIVCGIAKTTIGGTISSWYFSYDRRFISPFRVFGVLFTASTKAFGSIAKACLLLSVLTVLRKLLDYSEKTPRNCILVVIISCLRCSLACFESFVKFVTNYCFIYIAIYGQDFFTSCKEVMSIFKRSDTGRFLLSNIIIDFFIFIGLLMSVCLCVGGVSLYLKKSGLEPEDREFLVPVIFIAILSLIVFFIVCQLLSSVVKTVIVCFLEDFERHSSTRTFRGDNIYVQINQRVEKYVPLTYQPTAPPAPGYKTIG